MANLKSTLLTNRDATPKVLTDGFLSGGTGTESVGSVLTGTSDAAGSTYRLVQVPSDARLDVLKWQTSASLGSGCILDVAVWYPTVVPQGGANFLAASVGGTLISSSIFATALGGTTAAIASTDITNQSGNYTVQIQEQPMWQVLGLVSDPEIDFDMGFTLRAATAAAGYVGMKASYQF